MSPVSQIVVKNLRILSLHNAIFHYATGLLHSALKLYFVTFCYDRILLLLLTCLGPFLSFLWFSEYDSGGAHAQMLYAQQIQADGPKRRTAPVRFRVAKNIIIY